MDQCFLLQERKKSNKIVMIKTNYILMDKKIWLNNFLVLYILKEQITAIHMNIFIKSFFNWDDPNSHEPKEKLCWSDWKKIIWNKCIFSKCSLQKLYSCCLGFWQFTCKLIFWLFHCLSINSEGRGHCHKKFLIPHQQIIKSISMLKRKFDICIFQVCVCLCCNG